MLTSGHDNVLFSMDICSSVLGFVSINSKSLSKISSLTSMGTRPIFRQLFLKISAKFEEITTSKPQSCNPQGACSLDDPVPKLGPATRIFASL